MTSANFMPDQDPSSSAVSTDRPKPPRKKLNLKPLALILARETADNAAAAKTIRLESSPLAEASELEQVISDRLLKAACESARGKNPGQYRLPEKGNKDQTELWERSVNHILPDRDTRALARPLSLESDSTQGTTHTGTGNKCDVVLNDPCEISVDVSTDLPTFAREHPARVWNAIIHTLPEHCQPVIKWDYVREDDAISASLTLILPPSHHALSSHPLYISIPVDKYSRQYAVALSTLGGTKTWIGRAQNKAGAQNAALLDAMDNGVMEWLSKPLLRDVEDSNVTLREEFDKAMEGYDDAVWEEVVRDDIFYLVLGRGDTLQQYQVPLNLGLRGACNVAIELNVRGFISWIVDPESKPRQARLNAVNGNLD